jgi:hypothetical protein
MNTFMTYNQSSKHMATGSVAMPQSLRICEDGSGSQ